MVTKTASRWDELTQLEEAYRALATMDYDGRMRSLTYLRDRFEDEDAKAKQARADAAKARVTPLKEPKP